MELRPFGTLLIGQVDWFGYWSGSEVVLVGIDDGGNNGEADFVFVDAERLGGVGLEVELLDFGEVESVRDVDGFACHLEVGKLKFHGVVGWEGFFTEGVELLMESFSIGSDWLNETFCDYNADALSCGAGDLDLGSAGVVNASGTGLKIVHGEFHLEVFRLLCCAAFRASLFGGREELACCRCSVFEGHSEC